MGRKLGERNSYRRRRFHQYHTDAQKQACIRGCDQKITKTVTHIGSTACRHRSHTSYKSSFCSTQQLYKDTSIYRLKIQSCTQQHSIIGTLTLACHRYPDQEIYSSSSYPVSGRTGIYSKGVIQSVDIIAHASTITLQHSSSYRLPIQPRASSSDRRLDGIKTRPRRQTVAYIGIIYYPLDKSISKVIYIVTHHVSLSYPLFFVSRQGRGDGLGCEDEIMKCPDVNNVWHLGGNDSRRDMVEMNVDDYRQLCQVVL